MGRPNRGHLGRYRCCCRAVTGAIWSVFAGQGAGALAEAPDVQGLDSGADHPISERIGRRQGFSGLRPVADRAGDQGARALRHHGRIVDLCIEVAKGRVPVIAGTGSNSTEEAIDLTRHAKEAGADAALIVNPYYNRPTQEGLYQHFKAIHDSVDLPIIIYNIPGRTAVDMSVATMARLAKLPNVVGVKDATNDLLRPLRTREVIGSKFCMLSGEDHTALAFLVQGGDGCISVTANVAPRACADMHESWEKGDVQSAMQINWRL